MDEQQTAGREHEGRWLAVCGGLIAVAGLATQTPVALLIGVVVALIGALMWLKG